MLQVFNKVCVVLREVSAKLSAAEARVKELEAHLSAVTQELKEQTNAAKQFAEAVVRMESRNKELEAIVEIEAGQNER